ncbi:hypothetical protein FHU41_001912 [Psychromicrobium silvestre]|uniref:Uncharacterized protein n=1 Tax=Psychromicrobium silvestre TaxID=1645614 RepID=A0A7Y9S8T2_9MICC|nr:hypothetical protein [Psychromicrobium silvestre]NYE95662.1 hypothetical protein [Psychromicrobium silvestre]
MTQTRRQQGSSALPCIAGSTKEVAVGDVHLVSVDTAMMELLDGPGGDLLCPIAVDLEDSFVLAELGGSVRKGSLSLAALAEEVDLHTDQENYYASQTGDAQFSAGFFIPSGTFPANPEQPDWKPSATAIFAGEVLRCSMQINSFSGKEFCLATVRTIGDVTLDVAIAKKDLRWVPVPGNIIDGQFFLTGSLGLESPEA